MPVTPVRTVLVGTSNPGKLAELRALLNPIGYDVVSPDDLALALVVDETGETFGANAVLKAEAYRDASGRMSLADDSGLAVDALNGSPGVYSARYGGPELDDRGRAALVLTALHGVPPAQRGARFVCCIAIACPKAATRVFRGEVSGRIANESRGDEGFGYDPIFVPAGGTKTYGQMPPEEKALTSHRARALAAAIDYLSLLSDGYTEP